MSEIDILKKECIEYIKWANESDTTYFKNLSNAKNFCKVINENIDDDAYQKLQSIYDERISINNGNIKGNLSVDEIINLTIDFFKEISLDLQEKFKSDLNNGMISINPNNQNQCLYLSKTVDGKKVNFCKVNIRYTGTIYDVFSLVHEYFHTLTDVEDYKDRLNIDKNTIDYIQETISIFAEFVCAEYLSNKFPVESANNILYRIYEEVFISVQSGLVVLRYINALMSGITIEELNKRFIVSEVREILQNKKYPFSMNHFIGTMVSITRLRELENVKETLSTIYLKINEQRFEDICKDIPIKLNVSKVIEFINKHQKTSNK